MLNKRGHYFIALGVLGLAGLILAGIETRVPAEGAVNISHRIPLVIGQWQGVDVPLEKYVYDILGTRNVFVREYTQQNYEPVTLSIVYTRDNPDSIHPPEICYTGGGANIAGRRIRRIKLLDGSIVSVNEIDLSLPRSRILSWHCFSFGSSFTENYYIQQMHLMMDVILHRSCRGALLRIVASGDQEHAVKALTNFLNQIVPYVRQLDG